MTTSFVGVATMWAPEDAPTYKVKLVNAALVAEDGGNLDFANAHIAKTDEMIAAGKMVKGTISVGREWSDPAKYPPEMDAKSVERGPVANNAIINVSSTGEITSTDDLANGGTRRAIRLFVNEAAANAWINFALSFGALNSVILSEEELTTLLPGLPGDDVIRQFLVA
jgi:hypothetical protein